jgi:transposase
MDKPITYVGLDVHQETIAVALAEMGKRGEVREQGKIANIPAALTTLAGKLARTGAALRFCYEAGPCGYGIERQLTAAGHGCVVVAPSLIPRKPGERIKTDRRDAIDLAKLHRAGELTPVWVPDPAHEAIRDLVRARLAAVRTLRQARQQLSGFLLSTLPIHRRTAGRYRLPRLAASAAAASSRCGRRPVHPVGRADSAAGGAICPPFFQRLAELRFRDRLARCCRHLGL